MGEGIEKEWDRRNENTEYRQLPRSFDVKGVKKNRQRCGVFIGKEIHIAFKLMERC